MTFLDIYTVGGNTDDAPVDSSSVYKLINTYKFHILITIALLTLLFVILNFSLNSSESYKKPE
jgi:hypothetical protein